MLAGFVLLAAPAILRHPPTPSPWPPPAHWPPAFAILLFAIGGMEGAAVSGGELRRPARDLPLGLAIAVLAIATLYGAVMLASIASVPDLAVNPRPVVDGARGLGGPWAAAAIQAGGAVAMAGVLFGLLFSAPRVAFALAQAGRLPAALARLHPRFRTPTLAIVLFAAAVSALTAAFTTFGALPLAALGRAAIYLAVIAAAVRLTSR